MEGLQSRWSERRLRRVRTVNKIKELGSVARGFEFLGAQEEPNLRPKGG